MSPAYLSQCYIVLHWYGAAATRQFQLHKMQTRLGTSRPATRSYQTLKRRSRKRSSDVNKLYWEIAMTNPHRDHHSWREPTCLGLNKSIAKRGSRSVKESSNTALSISYQISTLIRTEHDLTKGSGNTTFCSKVVFSWFSGRYIAKFNPQSMCSCTRRT